MGTNFKTNFDRREEELENKRKNLLMFSFEGIEAEIKVWELIKSFNYSDKSFLFKRKINVDNVLKELYKAKEQKKVVELETKSLFVNYWTEEEIKKYVVEKLEYEKAMKEIKEIQQKMINNIIKNNSINK